MIEIKREDVDRFKSSHLAFVDDGPVSIGAKTRRFSVFSRANRSLLGYVKWYVHWKQYCFFPLNSVFDKGCMRQVAQFMEEATAAHMSRLPNKQRLKDMEKAKRQRKMERIALTKKQKDSILIKVETESDASGKLSDKEVIKSNPDYITTAEIV